MRNPTRKNEATAWTRGAGSGQTPLVKALWWGLCAVALALSLVFGLGGQQSYTLRVRGPASGAAAVNAAAVCPPRTLPDEGACVPLPRPTRSAVALPRLPTRPENWDDYDLPAAGRVEVGTWADLDVPEELPLRGDALVITSPPGAKVSARSLEDRSPILQARGQHWILLATPPSDPASGQAKGPDPVLLLLAPLDLTLDVAVGTVLAPGTVLGHTRPGGLGLVVRKLRPNAMLGDGSAALDDARSVVEDARNALPLRLR